jgi:hypothetical protein
MTNSKPPPPMPPTQDKHFTAFHSAAEEAVIRAGEAEWGNEGGHMSFAAGRIVRTPDAIFPYKVVMSHHGRADTARAFETMREAEAFIRRNTPIPAPRRTLYDRPGDVDVGPTVLKEVSP